MSGQGSTATRTMAYVLAIGCRMRGAARSLLGLSGPVSTAVGRGAVAANASVVGSECEIGGSVNSKRGRLPRSSVNQAS
ncbi:hypothetical protein AB0383_45505 [Amycolatopsis sp. NPDC051373]|uniref:hypothetical protein n=1 Tax=Amycolatopsis sp. NPDC051373 TaxID=3155801 RepID=UPI00344F261C